MTYKQAMAEEEQYRRRRARRSLAAMTRVNNRMMDDLRKGKVPSVHIFAQRFDAVLEALALWEAAAVAAGRRHDGSQP